MTEPTPIAEPELTITDHFFSPHQTLFERLEKEVPWESSMSARLTASYGVPYNYRQMVYPAAPMHPALVPVVTGLEHATGVRFNNCLLNFYPDGRSKMGFHSDDTSDLQTDSGVGIVSLGCARRITFRGRDNPEIRVAYNLLPGSLLFMPLAVQHQWAHAIKRQNGVGPRISLTWRAFREQPTD